MKKIIFLFSLLVFSFMSEAQDVNFSTFDGKSLSYEDLVSKPKTVFFVWATWCPYCVKEIKRLSKECLSIPGVEIRFLNVGQSKYDVEKFVKSYNIDNCVTDRIVLDTQNVLPRLYDIVSIPTYIYFREGKPVYKNYAFSEELAEKIFKAGQ